MFLRSFVVWDLFLLEGSFTLFQSSDLTNKFILVSPRIILLHSSVFQFTLCEVCVKNDLRERLIDLPVALNMNLLCQIELQR